MADRPVECSQCKKPIKYCYKEYVQGSLTETDMCADCPILEQKLHGSLVTVKGTPTDIGSELCCSNCKTTLEAIKTGQMLGCSECYEVFDDILLQELFSLGKLSPRLKKGLNKKKAQTLHFGKNPTKETMITPSNRLTALNEALNEALKKENYEQAAWLRDQIKALMEQKDDGKKASS